jgi:hypothetical protein
MDRVFSTVLVFILCWNIYFQFEDEAHELISAQTEYYSSMAIYYNDLGLICGNAEAARVNK